MTEDSQQQSRSQEKDQVSDRLQLFVADALMKSWFPDTQRAELLSNKELYAAWWDCAMDDASAAIRAVTEFNSDDRK